MGVAPIENEAIGPALTTVNEAGVPVFCVDRRGEGEVVSTLETDNVKAGEAMAEQLVKDYGEDVDVLIIQGVLSDTPTLDRTQGVKNVLEKYENITIVGEPSAGEYTMKPRWQPRKISWRRTRIWMLSLPVQMR
ncbi:sugar ABC transporter substrate-binding protein [[Clostridium] hylemonae]|uniref:sugar ABC transporter substrate-binding protein n=1 Tax=[Clostridium] hylemonae TaxID=89153 RepID=UPI0011EFD062